MNHNLLSRSACLQLQRRSLSVATLALFLAGAVFVSGQSSTITITFEDAFQQASYADYDGLQWSNVIFTSIVGEPASGYLNAAVSGTNVAFNGYGAPAIIRSTNAFDFDSVYLTAAWRNDLQVDIQGFSGQNLVYNETNSVNSSGPTLINFNYMDITEVVISTSGGVNPGYAADGTQVIMDNLTVTEVPEPAAVSCAVLGSALFLRFRKKRCASRVG